MSVMSTATALSTVPEFTLGWRLRISLELAEMKAYQMAEALEVSRQTLTLWMHDDIKTRPKALYLREWARLTGVDAHWLITGEEPSSGPKDPGGQEKPLRRVRAGTKRSGLLLAPTVFGQDEDARGGEVLVPAA